MKHLKKYWPIWLGMLLFVGFLAPYILVFGPQLSTKQTVWADFGNYIGGAVGPLFSLVAIVLVLQTLHVQREELRLSREELTLTRAELQRSGEALATQARQFADKDLKDDLFKRADAVFDELMEALCARFDDRWRSREASNWILSVEGLPTLLRFFSDDNWLQYVVPGNQSAESQSIRRALHPVIANLDELAGYLLRIDNLSRGDAHASNFYRRRLQDFVRGLRQKGYITGELMGAFDSKRPVAIG